MNSNDISAVPTNIITGFLGVGKTSAILNLLKHKPDNERWAVLVNEFGEIGVDGSLFQGQSPAQDEVFITEVPGGCMCCAAGLPMQIALNQLLKRAKPDRLLIEPTGLGHPVEVLQVLSSEYYRDVLALEKIVTLVDGRKLTDPRYTEHATFNQQIEIADLVVGNKRDLYQGEEQGLLEQYVAEHCAASTELVLTEHGVLQRGWLKGPTQATAAAPHHHHHKVHSRTDEASRTDDVNTMTLPACGYVKAENQGEGYRSIGWRFEASRVFDHTALIGFLTRLKVERMKAVFITNNGIFGYNLTTDALTETELDDVMESRIEIISPDINDEWQSKLLDCLVVNHQLNLRF